MTALWRLSTPCLNLPALHLHRSRSKVHLKSLRVCNKWERLTRILWSRSSSSSPWPCARVGTPFRNNAAHPLQEMHQIKRKEVADQTTTKTIAMAKIQRQDEVWVPKGLEAGPWAWTRRVVKIFRREEISRGNEKEGKRSEKKGVNWQVIIRVRHSR